MSEPRRWMDYGTSGVMPPVEVVAAADYDALRARVAQLEAALNRLYEAADASDDACYGTLGTDFVRMAVDKVLRLPASAVPNKSGERNGV